MPQLSSSSLPDYANLGDPLADKVIAALAQQQQLTGDTLSRIEAQSPHQDGPFRDWQLATQTVPEWVDWQQINLGRQLFLRHAPLAIASFVLGTLMEVYAPPGSAKVLVHTGRLRQDVLRRLYETATMVSAVLAPQGMRVGGAGHQAVLKVRLLHARVRHHVLQSGHWPSQQLGMPINQLQMGMTALGFSLRIVRGLQRLGIQLDADLVKSYQHLWRYANWLQGVDPALQADSLAGEAELYQQLAPLLLRPDDNSRILTDAVHQHLGGKAPFFLPSSGLQAISRHLLDATLADAYQLPRHRGWQVALRLIQSVNHVAGLRRWIPGLGRIEGALGEFYFHQLIAYGLAKQTADYGFKTAN